MSFNGEKVKNARLLRGYTLTELASLAGISKQSLSLYENNESKPDYEKMYRISSALKIPQEFFMQVDDVCVKTDATYFRSFASATKMSRISQSKKLELVAKMYGALLEYVDFPSLNLPILNLDFFEDEINLNEEELMENIGKVAEATRNHWKLGNGPIEDLQFTLEQNGIIVLGYDLSKEKIDAFSQRTEFDSNAVYFVAVDQECESGVRVRFDLAHELAHILLHPWSDSLELISKEEFKERERQANMFASAFLMPKETFSRDVMRFPTDLKYYEWLKGKWKCSIQAMIYRSSKLGIITNNQFQYMMRQVSRNGWRLKEPGDTQAHLHDNIFQSAIDLILENNVLSEKGIMNLFSNYGVSMNISDIEGLLSIREGTLVGKDKKDNIITLKSKSDINTEDKN